MAGSAERPPYRLLETVVGEVKPFYPTDEFLRNWHERDEAMAKMAGIQVHPTTPSDTVWMLPQRKADETDEEWARRCVIIKNVGKPETSEFYCETRKCSERGTLKTLPWREEPVTGRHYPLCETCGNTMRENVSAPNVIWTGPVGKRYRNKGEAGYENPDGQWAYTRKNPDGTEGKPTAVRLETWQDIKEYSKREGLYDPRDMPKTVEVGDDGKSIGSRGFSGQEI